MAVKARVGRMRLDQGSGKLLLRASRDLVVVIDPARLMALGKRKYAESERSAGRAEAASALALWDVTPSSCLRAMGAGPRGVVVRPRKGGSNWGGRREDPGRSARAEQGMALVRRGISKACGTCRLGSGWNDWQAGMRLMGKAASATEARFAKEVREAQDGAER